MLLDVNNRAKSLYRNKLMHLVDSPDIEPLLIETIAYDLAFLDHGIQENIFRYAVFKYELHKDPEIKEFLEDYYSK